MQSRLNWYRKELTSLGLLNWLKLKRANAIAKSLPKGDLVKVSVPGTSVYYRAQTSDRYVLYQIFIDREYRCLDHVKEPGLIIDCGANVGYASAYFLQRYPKAHVIAVEPDSGNFALLRQNVQQYSNRCTLLQSGVWSKSTGLVVERGGLDEWAYTVREAREGEKADLQAVDIGSLLARSGHDRISILKVDIEGSESEVFRQAAWLEKVDHLVIEIHGPECERVVMQAINGRAKPTRCEELTVFDLKSAIPSDV